MTLRSTGTFDASDQLDVVAMNAHDERPLLAMSGAIQRSPETFNRWQ